MEKKVSLIDFVDCLYLKNQILAVPTEDMVDAYKEIEDYKSFIYTLDSFLKTDGVLLMYGEDLVDKVITVIGTHRFDIKDDKETFNLINDIIGRVNEINCLDTEKKVDELTDYYIKQSDIREIEFEDDHDFKTSLVYDAMVYSALVDEESVEEFNDAFFYGSVNYLVKNIPVIFSEESVRKPTIEKINKIYEEESKHMFSPKKYVKETINRINKQKED